MNSISYIAHKVDGALGPVGSLGAEKTTDSAPDHQPRDETKEQSTSSVPSILHIVLFLPNLLIVRPLLFCWFIITFPLSLLEQTKEEDKKKDDTKESRQTQTNHREIHHTDLLSTTILELDEDAEQLEPTDAQANDLKSPTSPSGLSQTRARPLTFPRSVYPTALVSSNAKKTLILDLDETLIHSLSRGFGMSNGHMIEIKLNDQLATLYSVHKRPYCDHFLKQVSQWFNLVIFTASVREYADPVIDWLESERKYFVGRYYRNHCTMREGQGYIKDISSVEKNLNHVLIVDNSPISYAWHENNAITVEGWINDPSDTDLLNLIPFLKSIRYATDVRSVLSLKSGEAAFER